MANGRFLAYYTGAHWLGGVAALLLIAIFAGWLLQALADAQERAEKMLVEQTVRNMQTGLKFAMGEALVRGKENEIAAWAGSNPVRWLGGLDAAYRQGAEVSGAGRGLPGYRGDCSANDGEMLAGQWCFDARNRELVYWPRHGRHLFVGNRKDLQKELRWRVVQPRLGGENAIIIGLRLETVVPYAWFEE